MGCIALHSKTMRLESEFLIIFILGNMKMNKEKNPKTWRPKLENIDKLLLDHCRDAVLALLFRKKTSRVTQKKT